MANMLNDVKRQIAESEGFPIEKIDEFVAFINDEPYITSSGLQYKMLQTYKAGKFAVQSVMPSREEYSLLRQMMGLKDDDPLVVMRGEVWVEGFERPFIDYGTTTPKNLRGFVRFTDYPLEMATRRATNRAMRLATATGLCSIDEVKEPESTETEEAGATQGQIDLLRNLSRNTLLTEDERIRVEKYITEGIGKRQASELVDRIKAKIDSRRKDSKAHTAAQATTPPPEADETEEEPPDPEYQDFLDRAQKAQKALGDDVFGDVLRKYKYESLADVKPNDPKIPELLESLRGAFKRKKDNDSLSHEEFLKQATSYERFIGNANYQIVLDLYDIESAHAIPEDNMDLKRDLLKSLEAANKEGMAREERLKDVAGPLLNRVKKHTQEEYQTAILEHLTPEQAADVETWIEQWTTEQEAVPA